MRRQPKSVSLYSRIAMWFLRLHGINAVTIEVREFSHIDAGVITFAFIQRINSDQVRGPESRAKAVCANPLLSSSVPECIHGYQKESFLPSLLFCTFLPISKSTIRGFSFANTKLASIGFLSEVQAQTLDIPTMPEPIGHSSVDGSLCPRPQPKGLMAGYSVPLASVADVDLPSAVTERYQNGFSFERTVGFLMEGISTPKVHLESPAFKHSTSKLGGPGIISEPEHASPFPLRLTPSGQKKLLAMVHNDLLYRINNGLRFIGEVDKGIEKFEEVTEEIRLWVEVYGLKAAVPMIWAEYPGAATYFLVSAAVYEYTHGEYWDFALNIIGIPCTPIFQRYWGKCFLLFLRAVGLNPFDESGLRYVGPILAHAMIPNDCLPEFFGQLLEPAVRSPAWTGLSPQDLIATWLSHPSRFMGVDKPVWQFLRHGGRVAEEFVSEAVRMVRERYETGLIPQSCEFTLPPRIVQQYKFWLEQQREPPSPRRPFLKLDPYSGIQLAFSEQRLPANRSGQICSWEVSAGGQRLRGPRGYAQRRGEEAVFIVTEIPVPPVGPFQIQLLVGEETVGAWSLAGMTIGRSWKAFSGRNWKELEILRSLRAEPTWIVIPTSGDLIVRDSCGIALADVETQRCPLAEEWIGYTAVEVNLSTAAAVEVLCGNNKELINVEHPEGEVVFTGGNLLQNAENSPDNIALFGDTPPKVVLRTNPGEESASFDNVRIRIAGHGTKGSQTLELSPADLVSASQMEEGQVIIDLRQVIPLQICPGEMMIILWYRSRRAGDHRFRWVPGLCWEWKQDGRTVTVHLPKGAAVSERQDERLFEPFTPPNSCHTVTIPEGNHEIDLVLSWQRSGLPTFSVPLRINGPRWAFLRHPSDTPVWQVRPIEISPDDLLREDSPCLLLEVRDITLREAELRAKWIGDAKEGLTVDLGAARQVHPDRWLIRLAEIADTLRKFQDTDSHVIIEVTTSGSGDPRAVQICVMQLLSPTMFRWAFQLDDSSPLEWSEVCIDLNPEDLIEGNSPQILFEAKGGRWVDAEVCTFWRPHEQAELACEFFPVTCTERGRWRIHLAPIMEFLEESSMQDSEVCLEAKVAGIQEENKHEIALIRIHQHPATLQTYEDCKSWAEGNSLRILALDLLCDLHYKYRFSVDLLAIDWKISPELVRRALLTVRIECPDVTVNESQSNFWMSKGTYRSMYPVLNEWNRQRMWKE